MQNLNEILKNSPYLTKQNLALAIGKKGKVLDYAVGRLIETGDVIPLKKGFYAPRYFFDLVSQNAPEKERYLEFLANRLYEPSYISLEYVLSKAGIMPESVFEITSVTIKSTRSFVNKISRFSYRSVKESLFFGYETQYFKNQGIRIASPAKALFDYLYLSSGKVPDSLAVAKDLTEERRLNLDALPKSQWREVQRLLKKYV